MEISAGIARTRGLRFAVLAAVGLAAAVVLAGCAGSASTGPSAAGSVSTVRASPPKSHRVETIKTNLPSDFEVHVYRGADAVGGENVQLSSVLALGKPVALNFFAGQCPPCRAEIPDLQLVHNSIGDQFILLGVDVGPYTGLGSVDDAVRLVEELNVTFPTGSAMDPQIVNRYRVLGIPSTVFITTDGKVLRKWDGPLSRAKMQELVEQMIRASSS